MCRADAAAPTVLLLLLLSLLLLNVVVINYRRKFSAELVYVMSDYYSVED